LKAHDASISTVGSAQLAAQSDAVDGLQIMANGDVTFSAGVSFGTCGPSTPTLGDSYALVR